MKIWTVVDEVISDRVDKLGVTLGSEPVRNLMLQGGKKLRACLAILIAKMFDVSGDAVQKIAASFEMIHCATLLHDDVIDESDLRRGRKTANFIWGNKVSILSGDLLFSSAMDLAFFVGNDEVTASILRAVGMTIRGEILQLEANKSCDMDIDVYKNVMTSKTAALFASVCECGAILGGASRPICDGFYNFWYESGHSFSRQQMIT